jgi:transcriptional antiterminator RfaH
MTLTFAELNQISDPLWFCLKTHPKHEHFAAASLRQTLQVECLAPRIRFRKSTRRGVVWFVEPMFPGYLFAHFSYADLHRQVEHAFRVTGVLKFGDRVAVIEESLLSQLRQAVGDEETIVFDPEVTVGERIKIGDGAFKGLEAVVTRLLPAKERVRVLIDFLGRPIEADVALTKVISTQQPGTPSDGSRTAAEGGERS